jgi:hypothetical protein
MKKAVVVFLIALFSHYQTSGQQKDSKNYYVKAFSELQQMLKGNKKIDFKRAVFITENSFENGRLSYEPFCNEISATGKKLKELIRQKGFTGYKTAGNWAVFSYMTDTLAVNNYNPCTYDFNDFMGEKDWTKMFVTKLMRTKSGNCHSLPLYYKILCDEIGAQASLALAPNHLYIKHIDEKGQWTNVELTNGSFPRDQWMIEQMAISVEAIKSESYMAPLTEKETIALCMFDLTGAYKFQYGNDEFVLQVADTALKYFPKCVPLMMVKANYYRDLIEAESKKQNPKTELIEKNIASYKQTNAAIDKLGYKDMPVELYAEWVKSVEDEKTRRGVVSSK